MRTFTLSLAVVAATVVVNREVNAKSVLIQVTPDNIDKQPLAFTVKVKDVKEGKEFEVTVKPKAGKLPPARFLVPRFNVLQEDPRITAAIVNRVDREGESVVFSFQIPQKDLEGARFSLYNMSYIEKTDEKGKTEFVPMPAADIYRFFLGEFASSPREPAIRKDDRSGRTQQPAAKAEAKDPEDFRWLLDRATDRDGLDPYYKAMLEKLKKSKVPSGDKAKGVAFGHTGPLDARETGKVVGLLRIGINIPDFADRGDLIWVVRFEMISWGVTQEMWISSTTGAIHTMLPFQRKPK